MKRDYALAAAVLAMALPALAQEDFHEGELTLGVLQKDFDTNSSKFLEYRDVPQGPVASSLALQGRKGAWRYELFGRDVTQKDQRYFGWADNGTVRVDVSYLGIPHNFGNGGKSILNPTTDNEWRLSDTLQRAHQDIIAVTPGTGINFAFLSGLVAPSLAAAPANVDLKLLRGRTTLAFSVTPGDSDFEVGVSYFHERRSGTRAANGTSFGFGNVVETPEPVRYVTQDLALNAAYKGDWGVARAALRFNDFGNAFDTFAFDNPFRATDGTDGNAYQAPGGSSKNGPVFGLMSLPPDNRAVMESVGATIKLGSRTRLSADATLGQWTQDEDPLLPWTTNTAILTPGGERATTAPLPAATLGGKIGTLALNAFVHTRLTDDLGLNARYRRYDHDNKTPRYRLEDGYVRFDAVWEEIPRITVPYGYTSDTLDAYATYQVGIAGLEAGFKHNRMKRTFRETEDTTENVFRLAADLRRDWWSLRGLAEFGSRDFDGYDAVRGEEESFLHVPGEVALPANQTVLRRYDQAKRDLTRLGGQVEVSPGSGKFTALASYVHTKIEYDQSPVVCQDVELFSGQAAFCPGGQQAPLGLVDDGYDSFTLEANLAPSARASFFAFYTWEDGDILQHGRQSAGSLNFNPNDVWAANITTRGNSFGAGADFTLVPDKWFLGLFGRYQDIDGNNLLSLLPGYSTSIYSNPLLAGCTGTGDAACAIREFDDTRLAYVTASLRYQLGKNWTAGLGIGYEDYQMEDAQTENALNYMPASFFLQADNRDYRAWVGALSLSYHW
jgi:MtrB/PioB family decaheme-associated outer membrane protein